MLLNELYKKKESGADTILLGSTVDESYVILEPTLSKITHN